MAYEIADVGCATIHRLDKLSTQSTATPTRTRVESTTPTNVNSALSGASTSIEGKGSGGGGGVDGTLVGVLVGVGVLVLAVGVCIGLLLCRMSKLNKDIALQPSANGQANVVDGQLQQQQVPPQEEVARASGVGSVEAVGTEYHEFPA